LAAALESGNVFINSYGHQSAIPFGGYKSVTVGLERFQSRFAVH
jgi:acyl-CoA reductase-like NAD-dependent aldehyde dehydrogenase